MAINMNKIKDIWKPSQPQKGLLRTKKFIKTFDPIIEMKIGKDGVEAKVEFLFIDKDFLPVARSILGEPDNLLKINFPEKAKVKRIISGSSDKVYLLASKQASMNGLGVERSFNHRWNRSLLNLLNEPSPNKTMINLGVVPSTYQSGLYNIKNPSEILREKFNASGITNAKLFSEQSGLSESTILRHMAGTMDMSRDAAFKYSKVLGCDPSELLFNSLDIPVWGKSDTQDLTGQGDFAVLPGEIIGLQKEEYISCPREIYRPDVKAIRIEQENSIFHNHIAYYYNSNEPVVLEGQMVIVGVQIKNFRDNNKRFRYFFGIYRKNKNNKTVDIINADPEAVPISSVDPDEDCNSFDDLKYLIETSRTVIDDIKPEFVAPVIALVNPDNIKDKKDYIRDHSKFYNMARATDVFGKDETKKLILKNYIIEREKEKIQEEISQGLIKYGLTERQIEEKARVKAEQIFLRVRDTVFSDIAVKIGKSLRGVDNVKIIEVKEKKGVRAIDEELTKEEIDRINAIDDHLNDVFEHQTAMAESAENKIV
jgi:plasmid maintenance system antidote protein VapI